MSQAPPPDPEDPVLFDVVALLTRDAARGRLRPVEHYRRRFPGLEASVEREYVTIARTPSPARPAAPSADRSTLPRRVGPWELVRRLGRGGQGTVYLARAVDGGEEVALKVLEGPFRSISRSLREELRHEAGLIDELHHPSIAAVRTVDLAADEPWIALRYVPGETLAELSRTSRRGTSSPAHAPFRGKPVDAAALDAVLRVFEELAGVLATLHAAGVVHRDVKPHNVLITTEGHAVLLDFGVARALGESLPKSGLTLPYAPPEALLGELGGPRGDVHSLGVTLYEVCAGERPFQGRDARLRAAILAAERPDPRGANPYLPPELAALVLRAIDRVPERRPDAPELRQGLAALRADRGGTR
jgi:serine/threonine-protein kinase